MEQELNVTLPLVAPIKRGRGRPRKPDSELSAKTLANRQTEANKSARIERGRAMDERFKAEVESLCDELRSYSTNSGGYDSERHHAETFIDQGYRLLRSIGYDLKSIQMLEIEQIEEIWDAESSVPPDQQTHMPMFVDASADEMVWHCRQVHLTPALARFEIKVLEAVLQWGTENPANFEHRSALEKELEARKRGEDTFKPQPEQVKPEPKPEPRAPLIEQPEDFVSGYETSSEEQNRLYGFGTFGMARTSHS